MDMSPTEWRLASWPGVPVFLEIMPYTPNMRSQKSRKPFSARAIGECAVVTASPTLGSSECIGLLQQISRVLGALSAEIEMALGSVCPTAIRIKITSNAVTLEANSGNGEQNLVTWKHKTQPGRLLAFAMLMRAEGRSWSDRWGFCFHRSRNIGQIVKANSALRNSAMEAFPTLMLRVEDVERQCQHLKAAPGSSGKYYELRYPTELEIADSAEHAANLTQKALRSWNDEADPQMSFRATELAIQECSLFFPAYKFCHQLIKAAPEVARAERNRPLVANILAASRDLEIWLKRLRRHFDFDRIGNEYHEAIESECLAEIDARLDLVGDLRKIFSSTSNEAVPVWSNPANIIADCLREAKHGVNADWSPLISEQMESRRLRVFASVRARLRDSTELEAIERRSGYELPEEVVSDSAIYGAIVSLSRNDADLVYPEPDARHIRQNQDAAPWIEETAEMLVPVILQQLEPSDYSRRHVPLEAFPQGLADEFRAIGTAKNLA